jgi:hypothetical protein
MAALKVVPIQTLVFTSGIRFIELTSSTTMQMQTRTVVLSLLGSIFAHPKPESKISSDTRAGQALD